MPDSALLRATPSPTEREAQAVARGIGRLFARNGIWCLAEMPLRSGRRADLMGVDAKGRIVPPPFPETLAKVPLRFLTVDVQRDHFFLSVRSWSATSSSRLLWCERVLTWTDLDTVQARFGVHPNLVFVDAGYNAFEVYRECATRGWTALIGDKRATFVHKLPDGKTVLRFYSPCRKVFIGRGLICRTHYWSNLNVKDTLARLRRNATGGDASAWEVPEDSPQEYLAHLESEQRNQKNGKWLWEQIGSRPNHWLDCEAMQVAAAYMVKLIGRDEVEAVDSTADADAQPG
jgi:hypothetical protein